MVQPNQPSNLEPDEALALLGRSQHGRVVATLHALPHVWPVRYRVVDDMIVFAAPPGLQLSSRLGPAVLGFEVDDGSAQQEPQWSVMLVGAAHPVDRELLGHNGTGLPVGLQPEVVIGCRTAPTQQLG